MKQISRESLNVYVATALEHAHNKHGLERWGRHEFYAILKEEVDELWDVIKGDLPDEQLFEEIIQIMAVCSRYMETGDRYRDKKYLPYTPIWYGSPGASHPENVP